jgi:hypothetical protein
MVSENGWQFVVNVNGEWTRKSMQTKSQEITIITHKVYQPIGQISSYTNLCYCKGMLTNHNL